MISFFSFFVSVKGSTLPLANWWATKQLFKINFWRFCRQSLSTIPSHFCRPSVSHGPNSGKFYADGSISRRHERFIRVAYWISAAEKVPNDNINGFNNFLNIVEWLCFPFWCLSFQVSNDILICKLNIFGCHILDSSYSLIVRPFSRYRKSGDLIRKYKLVFFLLWTWWKFTVSNDGNFYKFRRIINWWHIYCIDTRKRCSAKAVHINCFEKAGSHCQAVLVVFHLDRGWGDPSLNPAGGWRT